MLKKILFLTITFLVIGLVVVSAQSMEELMREAEQIEARIDARGGTPTEQEMRRLIEIQAALVGGGYFNQIRDTGSNDGQQHLQDIQRMQQQALQQEQTIRGQPQQQQVQLGETAGWPTALIFSQCNLPNLRQPAGTTVSYTYDSQYRNLRIFIMNCTQNNANELSRTIQADGKAISQNVSSEYSYFALPAPSGLRLGRNGHYQVTIEFSDGKVELWAREVAG